MLFANIFSLESGVKPHKFCIPESWLRRANKSEVRNCNIFSFISIFNVEYLFQKKIATNVQMWYIHCKNVNVLILIFSISFNKLIMNHLKNWNLSYCDAMHCSKKSLQSSEGPSKNWEYNVIKNIWMLLAHLMMIIFFIENWILAISYLQCN